MKWNNKFVILSALLLDLLKESVLSLYLSIFSKWSYMGFRMKCSNSVQEISHLTYCIYLPVTVYMKQACLSLPLSDIPLIVICWKGNSVHTQIWTVCGCQQMTEMTTSSLQWFLCGDPSPLYSASLSFIHIGSDN